MSDIDPFALSESEKEIVLKTSDTEPVSVLVLLEETTPGAGWDWKDVGEATTVTRMKTHRALVLLGRQSSVSTVYRTHIQEHTHKQMIEVCSYEDRK